MAGMKPASLLRGAYLGHQINLVIILNTYIILLSIPFPTTFQFPFSTSDRRLSENLERH